MRRDKSINCRQSYQLRCEQLEKRLVPVTWPVPASHEMALGFGAGCLVCTYAFHEGIDIRASGNGGENVVAARGGMVYWKDASFAGGTVIVEVPLDGGKKEYDRYLHVSDIAAPGVGRSIREGDPIGKISSTYFPTAGSRHLHFDVLGAAPTRPTDPPDETLFRNPLLRFTVNADKDPLGNRPVLMDTNKDKKTLVITESGDATKEIVKQPIKGDVDLIADAVDQMSTEFAFLTNPYKVGYYVKPLFNNTHGVKNATDPYILAKFDDKWFSGTGGTKTSAKFGEVYDRTPGRRADRGRYPWDVTDHFIVTNTNGDFGGISAVDGS